MEERLSKHSEARPALDVGRSAATLTAARLICYSACTARRGVAVNRGARSGGRRVRHAHVSLATHPCPNGTVQQLPVCPDAAASRLRSKLCKAELQPSLTAA